MLHGTFSIVRICLNVGGRRVIAVRNYLNSRYGLRALSFSHKSYARPRSAALLDVAVRSRLVATNQFVRNAIFNKLLRAARVFGSLLLLPALALQGVLTRRRVPRLPSAKPPHNGLIAGREPSIRVLAIGESSVSGVGLASSEETVAAATARLLARITNRSIAWRSHGLSGASVREGVRRLLPCVACEPVDLVIVAFGANDAMEYRSPGGFADDLEELVRAMRARIGDAAVVIAGVPPMDCFPALPSLLRTVLGWRSEALQVAAECLSSRLPRVVVERFAAPIEPRLFTIDGFHPNAQAHALWGEGIARLALPLLEAPWPGTKTAKEALSAAAILPLPILGAI